MTIDELRIGYYVSDDAGVYCITALDGIYQNVMLSGVREGEWIPVEKIKPISLNLEWFERLGLTDARTGTKGRWAYFQDGHQLDIWELEDNIYHVYLKGIEDMLTIQLCYVHELQHIFLLQSIWKNAWNSKKSIKR